MLCGSRKVWRGQKGGKHRGTTWWSCTRTTPLSLLQRLYFAPGRHGRVHYRVVSVHWISSCHKIPCEAQSSTPAWINSTSTTSLFTHKLQRPHFTGSWPQYAICPIAHCSLPNAHCLQLPTKAGTEPREMGVKSFSVVNKEESLVRKKESNNRMRARLDTAS